MLRPIGDLWELVDPVEAHLLGLHVVVPAGYICDLASVPWWAWAVTYPPSHPLVAVAAVVHDWCYHAHPCTRPEADALFGELLRVAGASHWRSAIMWAAVRLAGGPAWRRGGEI